MYLIHTHMVDTHMIDTYKVDLFCSVNWMYHQRVKQFQYVYFSLKFGFIEGIGLFLLRLVINGPGRTT